MEQRKADLEGRPFGDAVARRGSRQPLAENNRRQTGALREDQAVHYLEKQGYEILERNYWCRFAELDIVAKEGEYLCFIEVKYRRNDQYEAPAGVISTAKMRKICRASQFYMKEKRILPDTPVRYDVVMMVGEELTLMRNAFFYRQ